LLVSFKVLMKASESFSSLLQCHRRPKTQPCAFTSVANELRIPNDDGEALLTICKIVHGRIQEVPNAFPSNALKEIALSCNRHQLTSTLSAWSSKWLEDALSKAAENEIVNVNEIRQQYKSG
jgi:hypothetical protein